MKLATTSMSPQKGLQVERDGGEVRWCPEQTRALEYCQRVVHPDVHQRCLNEPALQLGRVHRCLREDGPAGTVHTGHRAAS